MSFDVLQLLKPKLMGLLRHAAGGWAIYLVHRGYLSSDGIEQFTGAIMFLGAVGFSIADKFVVDKIKAELASFLVPSNAAPSRANVT